MARLMEQVEITDIVVLNPRGWFLEPIRLRINFKVNKPLHKGKLELIRLRMEGHLRRIC